MGDIKISLGYYYSAMNPLRKLIQKTGFDLHRYRPEPSKLGFLKNLNIRTVLDIGANVGQFAKEIREILPQAKIHSFEPIKECFDKLEKNMAGENNFTAYNFALGDKNEKTLINKSSYTPSSSILKMAEAHKTLFPHTKENCPEEIEIKKLDDISYKLDLNPQAGGQTLIKVDVQGYENKVIEGGKEVFKKAKAVIIETSFMTLYEGQPAFDDIYEKLKSLGFEYRGSIQEKVDKHTGKIISEDSLFVR